MREGKAMEHRLAMSRRIAGAQGSADTPVSSLPLAGQPDIERDDGTRRQIEQIAHPAARCAETAPFPDKSGLLEQGRLDREHIVAGHVLRGIDALENIMEPGEGRGLCHKPFLPAASRRSNSFCESFGMERIQGIDGMKRPERF